jgi:tetratricopeptide (TPR) repeat protein
VVRSLFSAGFPLGVHGVYYTPPSRVGQGELGLFVEKVSLFAEDKYEEALSWYKKALELEPDNRTAQSGLNRIQSELQGN